MSWQDQPTVRRGRSKEQRNDCPLLTLGLVLDACGFVRRSEVLAANVSESSTLADLLQALQAPPEAVVVLDKGLATAPNVAWLRELGWHYVLVSRERKRNFDQVEAQAVVTASDSAVRVYSQTDASGETRLYCQSERRQRKEEALVERAGQRLEQALEKLRAGLFPSPRRPSGWRRSGSGRALAREIPASLAALPDQGLGGRCRGQGGRVELTAPAVRAVDRDASGRVLPAHQPERLAGQQRVTAVFRRQDGRMLHVRKATQAEPGQQAIYDKLGIAASPGGVSKLIV